MLNQAAFSSFYKDHRDVFRAMAALYGRVVERFYDADRAAHCITLAALTGHPALLIGPPGVAKSRLIRTFCELLGVDAAKEDQERAYFEYLLTPFTEPTELFGSFAMVNDAGGSRSFERVTKGMLHRCQVAFLDEVFNGSSAILNSLLALLNEGKFHDRGRVETSALKLVVGATNEPPTGSNQLRAIYDRFVLRAHLGDVQPTEDSYLAFLQRDLKASDRARPDFQGLLEKVVDMREDYRAQRSRLFDLDSDEGRRFLRNLGFIVTMAKDAEWGSFSNRRIVQLLDVLAMQRALRAGRENGLLGSASLSLADYEVIAHHFMDIARPLDGPELSQLADFPDMPQA